HCRGSPLMIDLAPGRPPRDSIVITECCTGRKVRARIGRLTLQWARRLIMKRWWVGLPVDLARSSKEGDHAWPWDKYAAKVEDEPEFGSYVALTASERRLEAQGAIIYHLGAKSLLHPGEGAVYLRFVASAPRN